MPLNSTNGVTLVSAFIGGAFTIAAAIIGADLSGAVHISGSKPSPRITVTVTAAPTGDGTSGITNPAKPVTKGTVIRRGTFTLTSGYCADLDSGSSDWGVTNSCATDGTPGDIRSFGSEGIDAPNPSGDSNAPSSNSNAFAPLTSGQSSSLATCQSATDYVGSFEPGQLHDGFRFCVRTTAGNIALVQVKSTRTPPNGELEVTFAAVVWKG
jgi:hypothetical protein